MKRNRIFSPNIHPSAFRTAKPPVNAEPAPPVQEPAPVEAAPPTPREVPLVAKIPLGVDESGNTIFWEVSNYNPHLAITGMPGTGKSVFLQNVKSAITTQGFKPLLIDWLNIDDDSVSDKTREEHALQLINAILEEITLTSSRGEHSFVVFDHVPFNDPIARGAVENDEFHEQLHALSRLARSMNVHFVVSDLKGDYFPTVVVATTRAEVRFRQYQDQPNLPSTQEFKVGEKVYLDYSQTAIPKVVMLSS